MATLRTKLAVLAAAFVLAACSDDATPAKSEATESPTRDPVADAEAAVSGFYDDFAANELDTACEWWTDGYAASSVDEWNEGQYGPRVTSCPELLRAIRDVFTIVGEPSELLQVTEVNGELVDDTSARVDVMLAADDEEQETYELTLTDDGWRISGDDSE